MLRRSSADIGSHTALAVDCAVEVVDVMISLSFFRLEQGFGRMELGNEIRAPKRYLGGIKEGAEGSCERKMDHLNV